MSDTSESSYVDAEIPVLKPYWVDKYKRDSCRSWTKFYKRNGNRFFRDKHFTEHEFTEYFEHENVTMLEVGCGPGNLVFPLLKQHNTLKVYACDFSEEAVRLLQARAEEDGYSSRINLFSCNIAQDLLSNFVPIQVDIVSCIFVLSAIEKEKHVFAVRNMLKLLKPKGHLLFRDYAYGDAKHIMFGQVVEPSKIDSCTYVRQDGTLSYFFTLPYLREVITNAASSMDSIEVKEIDCQVIEKPMTNRATNKTFDRVFIQGVWQVA